MKNSYIRSLLVAAVLAMSMSPLSAMIKTLEVNEGQVDKQTATETDENALELELYENLDNEVKQLILDTEKISKASYAREGYNTGVRFTNYTDRDKLISRYEEVIRQLICLNDEHCGKMMRKIVSDYVLKHLQKKCADCFPDVVNAKGKARWHCLQCDHIDRLINQVENLRKYMDL